MALTSEECKVDYQLRSNFIGGIVSGSFKIILIWHWGTFPCATGCIEGLSLPSLLHGTGIEGASLWTEAGGYLLAFFSTLATNLVHILSQSIHKVLSYDESCVLSALNIENNMIQRLVILD